ncbi:MAG: carboxypeptidase-like regulatory domain-containing protein [Bryobacteraceae bacterium]
MPRWIRLLCIVISLMALAGVVCAQQRSTAGLYGRVTDQQSAGVPGASVTLTHVETGIVRTSESNTTGEFEFAAIPVGHYNLTVRKQGFSAVEQNGIILEVNDNRRVDVALTVGELSTTVNVEASAAAVDTSSSTLKNTVDSQRVVDLPLNGRNLADLAFLVPECSPRRGSREAAAMAPKPQ